ncbi:acetyltransferase [Coniochaeta ligniaria NRRL 30616]|uniref:Acetyltransferase n=1 Tax=Coniochaeta ligniaria NRRL 30616 TaxID=1408157 RepID=A0A1J7JWB7_9PEZI|nr:acetyltransferase [Coniochaeta ligniaria NRRL 30616]
METVGSSSVTLVELKRSLVPPRWEDSVRVLGLSECKAAGLSLAHAFADDDLAQYLVNSDDMTDVSAEDKWKIHVDIFTYMVAATCYNGIATTIGPDYDGVALWLPPRKNLDGWWTSFRSGLWRLKFQLSPEGNKRYDDLVNVLHDTKISVLGDRDDEAWYLLYLGTKPGARGKGYAKKLLEFMVQRADVENQPVYLESTTEANNRYYRKFGFDVKRDISLTRGLAPVRLSIMVRDPQPLRKVTYSSAASAPIKMFQLGGRKAG